MATEKQKQEAKRPDIGREIIQGSLQTGKKRGSWWQSAARTLLIPALAVLTGLVLGAVLIVLTSESVYAGFAQSIGAGFSAAWQEISRAYGSLFAGAFGSPARIIAALQSGDGLAVRRAINPILESLVASTPYIFAGLAVALVNAQRAEVGPAS